MSTMRNSVMLIGRRGADPEVKNFNDNKKVARFNIAVTEGHKNANDEWVNTTQWFPVVAWNEVADRAERLVQKGVQIAIDGKLHNNEWKDDKGQTHIVTEILMEDIVVLEKDKLVK